MFAGEGAFGVNGERKRLQYCDKEEDEVEDEDDEVYAEDEVCHLKNCHKIRSVQMSAIRCRLTAEQQHEERKYYYQQQYAHIPYAHETQMHEEGARTVINLARSHAMLDYAIPAHSGHISYIQQQQQQPVEQATHFARRLEEDDLKPISYKNSRSTSPLTTPTVLTTTTGYSEETKSTDTTTATTTTTTSTTTTAAAAAVAAAAAAAAANRRDHNIDYSTLFVQLSGTLPTLYRCVNCNKIVSNRWHHANIHRPQSHVCPVCGQKFTRRDNMKAHCKIKHADMKDHFFSHYVHM